MATWPHGPAQRVPGASSSSSCILKSVSLKGERDSWECSSPRTDTRLQWYPGKQEPYFSTSCSVQSQSSFRGPGRRTLDFEGVLHGLPVVLMP